MSVLLGVELEKLNALSDARDYVNERGHEVVLQFVEESQVDRDIYNSIKNRTPVEYPLKAFPIVYSPTSKQLEKAGIKDNVDVVVTLAMLDLTDSELDFQIIDEIRWEVLLNDETFIIKDKNQINHFADTYLNVTLGLFKK